MSNNKSRSSKPYDSSNSFVKKVASRVSGLIPKSTSWLSGWFSPASATDESPTEQAEQINNEEDNFQDALERPPPAKRFKMTADQQYIDTYLPKLPSHLVNQGEGNSRQIASTFTDTAAIAGPSGLGPRSSGFVASTPAVSSIEHQRPQANGDDCSESGESTSGCSSLEPQINRGAPIAQTQSRQNESLSPRKRLLEGKLNNSYLQNSRSLYLDRTANTRNNQTVGRRNNPSFCVNTFGSPMFGERGSVNDLIMNSPFYTGRTTYGGASSASYRRSVGSASISSSPANSEKLSKHTIKVKPDHTQLNEDSSMSQTAKRILATLEQFSTPILDAKRIPISQEPVLSVIGGRKRSRVDDSVNAPLVLEQPNVPKRTSNKPLHWAKGAPSTSQLTIPIVPDTLVFRRRERDQSSQLVSSPASCSPSNPDNYSLRTEKESSSSRNTLKMKPRLNDKEPVEPEMASEVNLPQIPLPISSLPTFDISVTPPKAYVSKQQPSMASTPSIETSSSNKLPLVSKPKTVALATTPESSFSLKPASASADASFSFSSPISVSSVTKDQPPSPCNNFTFSKPLPAGAKFSEPLTNCVGARPKANLDIQKPTDDFPCGLKPASELKTGSVMDILGRNTPKSSQSAPLSANGSLSLMDKFKPAAGTWECDKCLIRNKSDLTKCAACQNPREVKKDVPVSDALETKTTAAVVPVPKMDSGFGSQFKMAQGMWECTTCMVRNKDVEVKCVSCTTPKPGAAPPKSTTPAGSFSGWGDKFKPASNTWECSVCMVRNGSELTACQSCTTKKPGTSIAPITPTPPMKSSWGDSFKKPEGSWECGACMVTNKSSDVTCIACQGKKPGAESAALSIKENSTFSFGVPAAKSGPSGTPAFSFGIPKDTKEASKEEKSGVSSSTGFKFGESKTEVTATGFSFGVPAAKISVTETLTTSTATANTPVASTAAPLLTSPSPSFGSKVTTFGNKAADVSVTQPTVATENCKPTFSFGVPSPATSKPAASPMFAFTKPPESGATSQPSSSTVSPIGAKRKLGVDTPSSSAIPVKFGLGSNLTQADGNHLKTVTTSSSLVSSTSGRVFSFSSSSNSSSSMASPVTSTANGQNNVSVTKSVASTNIFSSFVSSPTSSSPAAPAVFSLGVATPKDESVTSTWKQSTSNNSNRTSVEPKSNANGGGTDGNSKPAFAFGSNVSSSGMAFGGNQSAGTATPTFSFGAVPDKTSASTKPSVSFGSPASSTPVFGAATGSLANTAPSFGSSTTPFGSSTSVTPAPTFQATNSVAPNFNSPATSAFSSSFGTAPEEKKQAFSFNPVSDAKKTGFSFNADDKKAPFTFGAAPEDPKKKAFSFTATTTAQNSLQASSPSLFTFGASSPAPATNGPAKPPFGFGNQAPSFTNFNSQPASSNAGFNFGNAAPAFGTASNNMSAATSFQGGNATNMFSSTGTFNSPFGSPNTQPSGFNFSTAAPTSFGAQNQPSATPAAPFNFSEPQKPTFNFSGNPVSFAATPLDSSGAPAPRRIKKAARRTTSLR